MRWLSIKNFENSYEASETGLIRSLDRKVIGADGVVYPFKGTILAQNIHKDVGYKTVSLWKNNKGITLFVHRIICETFNPPVEGKTEVNHKDGDKHNNYSNNVEWCTSSENSYHAVSMGLRTYTNRLTKDEFIECLQSVLQGETYKALTQRVPYKVPFLSVKLRKIAKELGVEAELNNALLLQAQLRARINGAKNTSK